MELSDIPYVLLLPITSIILLVIIVIGWIKHQTMAESIGGFLAE